MLETRVQMRLKSELDDYRIVVTVNVGVYSVESFENLADQDREGFWEGHACHSRLASCEVCHPFKLTYPAGKHGFIVDITLDPCHQMLDILRRRHLGRALEILGVLPEILKPIPSTTPGGLKWEVLTHQWLSSLDMTGESRTL